MWSLGFLPMGLADISRPAGDAAGASAGLTLPNRSAVSRRRASATSLSMTANSAPGAPVQGRQTAAEQAHHVAGLSCRSSSTRGGPTRIKPQDERRFVIDDVSAGGDGEFVAHRAPEPATFKLHVIGPLARVLGRCVKLYSVHQPPLIFVGRLSPWPRDRVASHARAFWAELITLAEAFWLVAHDRRGRLEGGQAQAPTPSRPSRRWSARA